MSARCPFCEAVHPLPPESLCQRLACPYGADAFLCAPKTEPATAVWLGELGLSDTKADVIDERLSIVWAREWWRRG